jgi:hypothetical protein
MDMTDGRQDGRWGEQGEQAGQDGAGAAVKTSLLRGVCVHGAAASAECNFENNIDGMLGSMLGMMDAPSSHAGTGTVGGGGGIGGGGSGGDSQGEGALPSSSSSSSSSERAVDPLHFVSGVSTHDPFVDSLCMLWVLPLLLVLVWIASNTDADGDGDGDGGGSRGEKALKAEGRGGGGYEAKAERAVRRRVRRMGDDLEAAMKRARIRYEVVAGKGGGGGQAKKGKKGGVGEGEKEKVQSVWLSWPVHTAGTGAAGAGGGTGAAGAAGGRMLGAVREWLGVPYADRFMVRLLVRLLQRLLLLASGAMSNCRWLHQFIVAWAIGWGIVELSLRCLSYRHLLTLYLLTTILSSPATHGSLVASVGLTAAVILTACLRVCVLPLVLPYWWPPVERTDSLQLLMYLVRELLPSLIPALWTSYEIERTLRVCFVKHRAIVGVQVLYALYPIPHTLYLYPTHYTLLTTPTHYSLYSLCTLHCRPTSSRSWR